MSPEGAVINSTGRSPVNDNGLQPRKPCHIVMATPKGRNHLNSVIVFDFALSGLDDL